MLVVPVVVLCLLVPSASFATTQQVFFMDYSPGASQVALPNGQVAHAPPITGQMSISLGNPLGTPGQVFLSFGNLQLSLLDVPPFSPNFDIAGIPLVPQASSLLGMIDAGGRINVGPLDFVASIVLRCVFSPGCQSDMLPDNLNQSASFTLQLPDFQLSPVPPGEMPLGANTGGFMLQSLAPILFSVAGFDAVVNFKAVEFVDAPEPTLRVLGCLGALALWLRPGLRLTGRARRGELPRRERCG